jgi:DNA polymerase-3 subunit alpha
LLASLDDMMGMAEQLARASASQQESLFGEVGDAVGLAPVPQLQSVPPWTLKEQLEQEKSVLGYYFSDHPYRAYQKELEALVTRSLADVAPHPDLIRVAGLVTGVRLIQTRRGRMMVATLDDGTASMEVTAFDEVHQKIREVMVEDAIVVVTCKATLDNFTQGVRLSAEDALSVEEARERLARCLLLNLREGVDMNSLRQHLGAFKPGECALRLRIAKQEALGEVELPSVLPEPSALGPLMAWLGEGSVEVLYR